MIIQALRLHHHTDEERVVLQVSVSLLAQLVQLHEQRAACGDVHLRRRPLEGGRGGLRAEGVHDVLLVVLVDEHEVDLLLEGPWQQGVVVATHQCEEEGEVCAFAHAIPVGVEAHGHLVTDRACEEWSRVDVGHCSCHGVLSNLGTERGKGQYSRYRQPKIKYITTYQKQILYKNI